MTIGKGKYDDLCTEVREKTNADGVVLMVISGNRGEGFSVQGTPQVIQFLPNFLRHMADQIEEDLNG